MQGSMRTVALRTRALVLRRKPLHGCVLRLRTPTGRGRTGHSDGDVSDPASGRPGCGVGPCVLAHATAPARSLPSMDPCGKAGDPMRIGNLILLGVPLVAVLGTATDASFPMPGVNPALDLMAHHDPAFHKATAVWDCPGPGLGGDPCAEASYHLGQCRRLTRRHRSWSASCNTRPLPARATRPPDSSSPRTASTRAC